MALAVGGGLAWCFGDVLGVVLGADRSGGGMRVHGSFWRDLFLSWVFIGMWEADGLCVKGTSALCVMVRCNGLYVQGLQCIT